MNENKRFSRNAGLFSLWLLPVTYLAIISAVIAHEIIGHGLIAALLGSQFRGFGILIDGKGWTSLDLSGLSPFQLATVYAGGAFITNLLCLVFVLLGIRFGKKYLTSTLFFVLAFVFLSDGNPYFFWDSIYRGGVGDPSAILKLYPNEWLRGVFIVSSGVLMLTGILIFNFRMLTRTYARFKSKGAVRIKEIAVIATILLTVQALVWLSFDWKRVIPVKWISRLAPVSVIMLTMIILGVVAFRIVKRKKIEQESGEISFMPSVIIVWSACIALVFVLLIWFQNGVKLV